MKHPEITYCKDTSKFCYSSEAKATRAINRYNDITRAYYCESCDCWHITSMNEERSEKLGFVEPVKEVNPKKIKKRLSYLRKKLGL